MRNRQLGVSLTGLIIGAIILVIAALLGMKVLPPYIEYFNARKLITQIANERPGSPADVRRSFDLKSGIDDVRSIESKDLEISKEGNEVVISFAYRKEVPLFANVGLYLDFYADSKGRDKAPE
jgi:hypothetical protein